MQTGDRIKLSGKFIRSIGSAFPENIYRKLHQYGTIQSIKKVGPCFLVLITWDDGSITKTNIKNLQRV